MTVKDNSCQMPLLAVSVWLRHNRIKNGATVVHDTCILFCSPSLKQSSPVMQNGGITTFWHTSWATHEKCWKTRIKGPTLFSCLLNNQLHQAQMFKLKSPGVAPKKSQKSTTVKRRQGVQGWDFEQGKHFRSCDLKDMQTSWTEQCGTWCPHAKSSGLGTISDFNVHTKWHVSHSWCQVV